MKIRRPYIILLAATMILAASVLTLRYSSACRLDQVEIRADESSDKKISVKEYEDKKLFSIPLDQIVDQALKNKEILQVNVRYSLPDKISITCNDLKAVALVLDKNGRKLYELDENSCILPFSLDKNEWAYPIITGAQNYRPFTRTNDITLLVLTRQLKMIRDDFIDFYLMISEIEIISSHSINVYLDGLPYTLKTYAGTLYKSIKQLQLFLLNYNPGLDDVKILDMRSENLIIAAD